MGIFTLSVPCISVMQTCMHDPGSLVLHVFIIGRRKWKSFYEASSSELYSLFLSLCCWNASLKLLLILSFILNAYSDHKALYDLDKMNGTSVEMTWWSLPHNHSQHTSENNNNNAVSLTQQAFYRGCVWWLHVKPHEFTHQYLDNIFYMWYALKYKQINDDTIFDFA